LTRIVVARYKPMLCAPGVPQWSPEMQHAYMELLSERKGAAIPLADVEARAEELRVIPALPPLVALPKLYPPLPKLVMP
jgi:hypothetical protein